MLEGNYRGFFPPVCLLVLLCLSGTLAPAQDAREDPARIPTRIVLTWSADPSTTQAVTWRTEEQVPEPRAQIALLVGNPKFVESATPVMATSQQIITEGSATAWYHSVTFQGLKPKTDYCYRVGSDAAWSEWSYFRTANDKPEPFRFIYVGDAQNRIKSMWSRTIRKAFSQTQDVRFVLHAGDLINRAEADWEWGEWCYSLGFIASTIPQVVTPGNHEYASEEIAEGSRRYWLSRFWRPQFELPPNGPEGREDLREAAYTFDYQGVRFVSLDSNHEADSEQAAWLDKVLTGNPNRWTIVTHHHPIYSTGNQRDNPELRAALLPIYDKHHVDLVLTGHDHSYGRSHKMAADRIVAPEDPGTLYVVSISGPKMYPLNPDREALMAEMIADTQLYQVIEIDGDTLRYRCHSADGAPRDSFELHKRADGSTHYLNQAPGERPSLIEDR